MPRRFDAPLRPLCLLLLLLLPACGGGDDGPTDPGPPTEADAPTVSSSDPAPMEPLVLGGLPEGRTDLVAEVTAPGASRSKAEGDFLLPLLEVGGGDYRLWIPVHPTTITDGGAIEVRVRGDGLVTAPAPLTLGPLPPAPGAFAGLVDSLQSLLDLRFAELGTSRQAVLSADWSSELDAELFPTAVAQTLLDDPRHDRDLRDLLADPAAFEELLGTTELDLDLLDRLTAAGGLGEVVSEKLALARAQQRVRPHPALGKQVSITTASQLDAAMNEAWAAAQELDPDSATGELLQGYGLTLGAIGLVTGPGGTVVAAGLGSALWAYQTYLEGKSKLLPREFVAGSLLFDADILAFEEDQPGPGTFSNVSVSAQSEGWKLDKTIADLLLQVAGNADAYLGWINRVGAGASDLIRDIGTFVAGTQLGNLPIADSGLVEIPPEVWADIDISGEEWSEARVVGGTAIELSGPTTYEPCEAGEALLTVETNPARFGEATPVFRREPITVNAIEVTILAGTTNVDPGDVVELQVLVEHALDTSLTWSLSPAASWASGPTDLGGGTWSAQVQTPSESSDFPVQVIFESTAEGGARDKPGAPVRRDVLSITGNEAFVTVTPASDCLEPGESRAFQATVTGVDDTSVTWSATGPVGAVPMGSGGSFTAPATEGEYLITATSVEDPSASGFANVTVGGCECSWSLSISGSAGGNWSGVFATHSYPNAPLPGSFQMSFAPDAQTAFGGSGQIIVTDGLGPGPGATGSWQVTFSFGTGQETWTAVNDSETDATLVVSSNDGNTVTGSVSGTALRPTGNAEAEYVSFSLTFRSNDLFGEAPCGSD